MADDTTCPGCGAPMEVYYLRPGDRWARCHYCGRELDLPDDLPQPPRHPDPELDSDGELDSDDELDSDEVWELRRGERPRTRHIDQLDRHSADMIMGVIGGLGVLATMHHGGARGLAKSLYRARKRWRRSRLPLPWGRRRRPSHSRLMVLALSLFFGPWGLDRFYLGQPVLGLLKLITCGGCGLWWALDVIRIATGSLRDGRGRRLR